MSKVYRYTCKNCGEIYQTKYRDRDTCCSRECGFEWASKRVRVEKSCLSCNKTFCEKQSGNGYCSDKCKSKGKRRECDTCGKIVYKKVRCKECDLVLSRERYAAYMREKKPGSVTICKHCGNEFTAAYGDKRKRFCSLRCSRKHGGNHRKYLAKTNGNHESVYRHEVMERDGWICGVCGDEIDPALDYPDKMSASLDHIIPLTKGGAHNMGNVQAAHLLCNIIKSDYLANEQ
jgi:hypothetical protein